MLVTCDNLGRIYLGAKFRKMFPNYANSDTLYGCVDSYNKISENKLFNIHTTELIISNAPFFDRDNTMSMSLGYDFRAMLPKNTPHRHCFINKKFKVSQGGTLYIQIEEIDVYNSINTKKNIFSRIISFIKNTCF